MENQPTKTNNITKIFLIIVALVVTFVVALSVFAWWRVWDITMLIKIKRKK